MNAAAEELGTELVQLSQEALGIKTSLKRNLQRLNLAQLKQKDGDNVFRSSGDEQATAQGGEPTISDLTSNAKEEIKDSMSNNEQQPKKEEANAGGEKKEEKKEEPKKEEKKESDGSDGDSDDSKNNSGDKKEENKDTTKKSDEDSPKEQQLAAQEQNQTANSSAGSGKEGNSNQDGDNDQSNASKDVKVVTTGDKKGADASDEDMKNQAIMITGATHARELLSSQVPLFIALKLLHQGYLQNNEKY